MERKKEQAKVLSQEMLADGIYSLWIETEAALTARPGQFVSVYSNNASVVLNRATKSQANGPSNQPPIRCGVVVVIGSPE